MNSRVVMIKCQDCKWFKPKLGTEKGKCRSKDSGNKNATVYDRSFCAFGERKEEGK